MKKALFSFTVLSLLIAGACSSDGDSQPVTPTCSSAITSLNIAQSHDIISVDMNASAGALYYEISIQPAGNSNINPENGNIEDLETTNGTVRVYQEGNYVFYARTVCPDGTKGVWFGPKLLNVQPFCQSTAITAVTELGIDWDSVVGVNTFQLQYGPSGFPLGAGMVVNVNNDYYGDLSMAANQTYDFYVRPYCPASSGYGNWSAKYTYTASYNVNMCLAPTNIVAQYTSPTVVNFNYNGNGESQWEFALTTGAPPTQAEIRTLNQGYMPSSIIPAGFHGTFYMRAVCANGARTNWTTINI